jgi:HEAT repeat protein
MDINFKIAALIAELGSKNGLRRERARRALVKIGTASTPALVALFSEKNDHLRWEACKALGSIRDPASGVALVKALCDDSEEVRWLAAEALIGLGPGALVPILQALKRDFGSPFLRQGAHHVLHALERKNLLTKKTLAVLDALRYLSRRMSVASAADAALMSLQTNVK